MEEWINNNNNIETHKLLRPFEIQKYLLISACQEKLEIRVRVETI